VRFATEQDDGARRTLELSEPDPRGARFRGDDRDPRERATQRSERLIETLRHHDGEPKDLPRGRADRFAGPRIGPVRVAYDEVDPERCAVANERPEVRRIGQTRGHEHDALGARCQALQVLAAIARRGSGDRGQHPAMEVEAHERAQPLGVGLEPPMRARAKVPQPLAPARRRQQQAQRVPRLRGPPGERLALDHDRLVSGVPAGKPSQWCKAWIVEARDGLRVDQALNIITAASKCHRRWAGTPWWSNRKLLGGQKAMRTLNETFAPRLDALGIRVPEILLPRPGVDLSRWAVVACDQYTSDEAYWEAVDARVGTSASTLRLVLPELYLEHPGLEQRITRIHSAMAQYLAEGMLRSAGEALVYVRRTTDHSGLREGLVFAMDLERYSYETGSTSLIRATEGTIVDRIPPRLAVRRAAPLELPHIMILVADPERSLIEPWSERRNELETLYDVDLMQGGGHLEGYAISAPAHVEAILGQLERLLERTKIDQATEHPLFWAMGDGNHSLATAKARWEEIKAEHRRSGGSEAALVEHPARFALAEVVNIHSSGLRFEPIHRAVFCEKSAALYRALQDDMHVLRLSPIDEKELAAVLASPQGQDKTGFYDGRNFQLVTWDSHAGLPPGLVDKLFARFKAQHEPDARIDFIHGWDDTAKLCGDQAVAFFLPVIARERLFAYVQAHGPLPRKSFSMGDAEEKRYYMEARKIVP